MPVNVREGRDLLQKMTYGNHHSVNKHDERDFNKVVEDTARGRTTAFRADDTCVIEGLCIPVAGGGGGEDQASCYPRLIIRRSDPGAGGGRATAFG